MKRFSASTNKHNWIVGLVACVATGSQVVLAQNFKFERIAANLDQPVQVLQAPGDNELLYFVERQKAGNSGQIKTVNLANGEITRFLAISNVGVPNEGGLHSMAFHPDFQNNGKFYISWVEDDLSSTFERSRVDEYTVGINGTPTHSKMLLSLPLLINFPQHAVDWIGFKPGTTGAESDQLYITLGDGGIQANASGFVNVSQDLSKLYGKDCGSTSLPPTPTRQIRIGIMAYLLPIPM